MTRTTTVRRAATSALLVATMLLAPAATGSASTSEDPGTAQRIDPDQAVAEDDAVLEQGHVDIGPRYDGDEWTLMVHDDTRAEGSVWRRLDRTVLRITDAAVQQVPDDPAYSFLGADPGSDVHVVPQTQNSDVVWIGWNTQDPQVMQTIDRGATLRLKSVTGPGHLLVYLQDGGFGAPDVLWDSRENDDQSFFVDVNTHTHANWVFSEPGSYLVEVEASAPLVDGTEVADTQVLRLAVGDETDPQETLAARSAGSVDEEAEPSAVDADPVTTDPGGVSVPAVIGIVLAAVLVGGALVAVIVRGRSARRSGLAEPSSSTGGDA